MFYCRDETSVFYCRDETDVYFRDETDVLL